MFSSRSTVPVCVGAGQEQQQQTEGAPGNRMQLEMIDAHVRQGSAAPAAILDAEAHPDESAAQVPGSFRVGA